MNSTVTAKNGATRDGATDRMLYSAATLSFLAEAIHLWVTPEHYLQWLGYGIFFLVVAALQGILGRRCSSGRGSGYSWWGYSATWPSWRCGSTRAPQRCPSGRWPGKRRR